ncbi:hypothetical protein MTR67_001681, partial [Solanum verrucosum]
GDPTMYESYWRKIGNKCNITFNGDDSLSYFAYGKSLCWLLESKLEEPLKRLHNVVGNAILDDHYIVVGTGSSQLVQAALYALSPSDQLEPIGVVSATFFYSVHGYTAYPCVTDFVRSGLNKWAGEVTTFEKDEPYIELITSPYNTNGIIREHVVNGDQEKLIYDLAYYWPQYTSITSCANHDVMLFTISKCTGHAGSRIGWALVKDKEVARKMTKFMEICTIVVSKEAQLRDAKILEVVSNSCLDFTLENFLEYSQSLMIDRWKRLRQLLRADHGAADGPSSVSWLQASVYWFLAPPSTVHFTDRESHRGSSLGSRGLLAQDEEPIHDKSSRSQPVVGFLGSLSEH